MESWKVRKSVGRDEVDVRELFFVSSIALGMRLMTYQVPVNAMARILHHARHFSLNIERAKSRQV